MKKRWAIKVAWPTGPVRRQWFESEPEMRTTAATYTHPAAVVTMEYWGAGSEGPTWTEAA